MIAINTRVVTILRYGASIIDWKESEQKRIDRKSRKMMKMYGTLNPKSEIDSLYMKRKEGTRGLSCVEHVLMS